MEGSVTLIIKAANQSVPDQHMDCDLDWSVLYLKDHLSSAHPIKPNVDEQRLIYSGQLLLDNLLLRHVLRHPTENNAYTIHLVCSPKRNSPHASTSLQASPSGTQRGQSSPAGSQSSPQVLPEMSSNQDADRVAPQQVESPQDSSVNNDSPDGLRRRNLASNNEVSAPTPQSIDATSTYPSQSQIPVGVLQASADPMQQVAAMQQMYAHYMAYMQYMQMGGGVGGIAWPQQMVQLPTAPNPATSTTTATPTVTTAGPTVDHNELQQQDHNEPAQQQQQQQQQPQQIRMNAQGGEVEDDDDDEGMGRDWLDWIYVLSRMLVLVSIVYFYSTLSRFMIVVCIAMLLYLYQAGWLRPARRIEQPQVAENDMNNIQDDRNNNVNNNNNNNNNEIPEEIRNREEPLIDVNPENEVDNEAANSEATERVVEEMPVRPSILALTWTFLTAFFTSLIPEQPQAI